MLTKPTPRLPSETAWQLLVTRVALILDGSSEAGLRVIAIDDFHYSDEASLRLLQPIFARWLDRAANQEPAPQLVLSMRREALSANGLSMLEVFSRHAMGACHELQNLGEDEICELLRQLPLEPDIWNSERIERFGRWLTTYIGGNPGYLLEALKSLWVGGQLHWPEDAQGLPPTLVDSVRARLSQLPDDALQLAQLAAIAQCDFDLTLASTASGKPPLALSGIFQCLQTAQVFDGSGFLNDLVTQAIRSGIPPGLAAQLHRMVGDHVAAKQGSAARIAWHYVAAGDQQAAAVWQRKAGEDLLDRWQLDQAAHALAQAAKTFDALTNRIDAFQCLSNAVRCWISLRDFSRAHESIAKLWALAQGPADTASVRARAIHLSLASDQLAAASEESALLANDLDSCAAALSPDELTYALRAICSALQAGVNSQQAFALAVQVRNYIERAGGEPFAGYLHAMAGIHLWDGHPVPAIDVLAHAWQTLEARADPELRASIATQLMYAKQLNGDLAGAILAGKRGRAVLGELAACSTLGLGVEGSIALFQVIEGRLSDGLETMAKLELCYANLGAEPPALYLVEQALIALVTGCHDAAERHLLAMTALTHQPSHEIYEQVRLASLARLALARGESPSTWINALHRLSDPNIGANLCRRTALAMLGGIPLDQLHQLAAELQRRGLLGLLRTVQLAIAVASRNAGLPDAARRAALNALRLVKNVDAWCDETARGWLCAGEVLLACGDPSAGHNALARGAAWVRNACDGLADPTTKQRWLNANPIHRSLLQRSADSS